mmetsp:Transcript_3736/g.16383  ORF Transcript_3736/g.16383 Transcript_3736/m.16383 type:complete len:428 (-) Transcript_3736:1198-2481(-)
MSRGRAVELSNLSAPVQPIIFVVLLHDVIFLVLRVVREPFVVLRVPKAQQHALAVVVLILVLIGVVILIRVTILFIIALALVVVLVVVVVRGVLRQDGIHLRLGGRPSLLVVQLVLVFRLLLLFILLVIPAVVDVFAAFAHAPQQRPQPRQRGPRLRLVVRVQVLHLHLVVFHRQLHSLVVALVAAGFVAVVALLGVGVVVPGSQAANLVHANHAVQRLDRVVLDRGAKRIRAGVPAAVHERSLQVDGGNLGVIERVDGPKRGAKRVLGSSKHGTHLLILGEPEGRERDVAGARPRELRAVERGHAPQQSLRAQIPNLAVEDDGVARGMKTGAAAVAEPVELSHRVRQSHVPQHVPPQHHAAIPGAEAHVGEPGSPVEPRRGVGGDVRGREREDDGARGAVDQSGSSHEVLAHDHDFGSRRIERPAA